MAADARPFDPTPKTDKAYEKARNYLKRQFATWCGAHAPDLVGDVGETLIHQKWALLDGDLGQWTCADLDDIYLELHPAKVVVPPEDLDSVLEEGKAWIVFLAVSGWLDATSDDPAVMIAHLDEIGPDFARSMADESLFSPGKQVWSQARAEGVDIRDDDAVKAFVAKYNARLGPSQMSPFSPFMSKPAPSRPEPSPRPSLRLISGRATPAGTPPRDRQSSAKRKRKGR
jgi:hypothetical protein